jgi:hypothetical protein
MTKSYKKICDYCKNEIEMSDKEGKWQPYNLDNGKHDCRDKDRPQKQPEKEPATNQQFTLDAVLKKLESVGVKVNLMELMKQ